MESANVEKSTSESVLCKQCNKFYGTASSNFLCSSCFKKQGGPHIVAKPIEPLPLQKKQELPVTKQQPKQVQEDKSKCFQCKRKVGLLGYNCRCDMVFCKLHRMPQEHSCKFDYAKLDREKLQKSNPLVKAKKLGDI